ncbi:Uncharacterized protein TCAP_00832 [Tolypocladium capitatum]|uniref:Gastric mucin-like protein n=1 Tax=Tolypocladium capitatum TaxID=45235 RepID=A0A2K3QNY5_9HYPO|nr:Uncharacterized protein TCAP_00832 [Tolypocladium capitatum]
MAHKATELLGRIVAFEGRPDTISTQLRLLPTSAQVLILPSVRCYISAADLEQDFDARLYVRQVHDALVARSNAARAFLQGSTPTNKRLVFMNGGTPSAQALCIKAIMKHETCGSKAEAGAIFDDLIKDGLAGLENPVNMRRKRNTFGYTASEEGGFEDPITRAMRAADALDRQTANLQPSSDLDLTTSTRQRSSSLPLYGYSDEFGDAAPFLVFGAPRADDRDVQVEETVKSLVAPMSPMSPLSPMSPMTPSLAIMRFHEKLRKPTHLSPANSAPAPSSPSCIGETYEPTPAQYGVEPEAASPISDVGSVRTSGNVVYGEASLLDMRCSAGRGSLVRVKSLDRIYPASPKFRDLCIPSNSWLAEPETPTCPLMATTGEKDAAFTRLNNVERTRSVVVRSRLPVVEVAPVPQGKKKNKKRAKAKTTYVDRGTDAGADPYGKAPFQPVFSCTEDLLLYLKEGTPDGVLESMVNAFKDGRYPLLSHSPTASEPDNAAPSLPGTPNSKASGAEGNAASASEEVLTVVPMSANVDDYDPFAYTQPTLQPPGKSSQVAPKVTNVRPPTPARSSAPSVAMVENEHKFHEFTIAPNQAAVAVQNSLRSILGEYFPPDTQGYHQFQFSLLPELDGLWKPIFRATVPDGPQGCDGNVNQILAIGSQKGIKKEYSLAITGRLEKLGSKSSGLGRADRLDFRYLLANAMQAFTAQPLANQTSDNPFTNSYLLATLIVPHLETYLALHAEVRYLLLQYPPEHLGTVLALQKLLGVDLMTVAQIVDSNSKEHLPFTHLGGVSIGSKSEGTPTKRWPPSPRSSSDVPVSKANYLLTSTASDKDIAKFVTTVWNIPAEASDSEPPEPSTPQGPKRKAKPSPLPLRGDGLSPFPNVGPRSPLSSKATDFPTSTMRPSSIAETVRTLKSAKSRRSNAQAPSDAVSIMTFDPYDDSDCDLEERRLMPLFMRKVGTRKPNSRKALKFLGLA